MKYQDQRLTNIVVDLDPDPGTGVVNTVGIG